MLQIDRLSHRYPGAQRLALDAVSLSAARGSVLGLLGPNGAGKTTLISHLTGLVPVGEGRIQVDGMSLQALRAQAPARIAVAPQEYAFYPMLTVAENLACFAAAGRLVGARCRERIAACLAVAQLEGFADVRAERLSGGLKRRLNLAIALLPEPELVLFDEPTVGVDPQSRAFILEAIRTLAQRGAAVIYASHYMQEIEAIADRVAILDQGRLLREGAIGELLDEGARVLTVCAPGLTAEWLRAFGEPTQQLGHWRVQLHDAVQPAQVLSALDAAGIAVRQFEFGRYNLEQLFMALTHRPLQDTE